MSIIEEDTAHQKPTKIDLRWVVLGALAVLILTIAGLLLWRNQAKVTFGKGLAAYQAGDCATALPHLNKVANLPALAGDFIEEAVRYRFECLAFQEADQLAVTASHADSARGYESFLSRYPASPLIPQTRKKIIDHYLAWGAELHGTERFSEARALYQRLDADYPEATAQATEQIIVTTLAWAAKLQTDADFSAANDLLQALRADHPDQAARIDPPILSNALAWGAALRQTGDWPAAIARYDEQAARGDAFAQAFVAPREAAYLEWGAALTQSKQFSQAEQTFRKLLQLTHDRLAPLTPAPATHRAPWPYPYGVTQAKDDGMLGQLRTGPDERYPELADADQRTVKLPCAVVGASPDLKWYALSVDQGVSRLGDVNSPAAFHSINWQHEAELKIVWAPAAAVKLAPAGLDGVPLANGLAEALAAQSPAAADALTGLLAVYRGWAENARAQGQLDAAAVATAALAELTPNDAERQRAWEALADVHLGAAVAQAAAEPAGSLRHALAAEDISPSPATPVVRAARTVRIGNLLALGDQAVAASRWSEAVETYTQALDLESTAFSADWATVKQAGTALRVAPDAKAQAAQTLEAGRRLPALARQGDSGWVLVLAPVTRSAQAWLPTAQITLTVPITDLVVFEPALLPALRSYTATVNLAHAQQAWGQALADDEEFEGAVTHYRAILGDPYLRTAITGTAELAATALTAWGDGFLAKSQELQAIPRYAEAVAVAPKSPAGQAAAAAITKAITSAEQAVAKGGDCNQPPRLDALLATAVKQRAAAILPQALYQCGQARLQANELAKAKIVFQRVIDEFPKSTYVAKARRGVQHADWITALTARGSAQAAEAICTQVNAAVKANVASLSKPYIVEVYEEEWWVDIDAPSAKAWPAAWSGEAKKTTVVVCVGKSTDYLVESCPYTGGRTIERRRYIIPVRIVDPIGRLTVAAGKLYGSVPETCPYSEWFSSYTKYYYGDYPNAANLTGWLKTYLK